MIRVWRICKRAHAAEAFSGEGARRYAGRWHHAGTAVVYTSTSRALAALEVLVHLEVRTVPPDFVVIPADIPDESVRTLADADLPPNWRALPAPVATRDVGSDWVSAGASLGLRVPSVVVPGEANVLLNPAHPDVRRVRVGAPLPFVFDPRLAR